MERFSAGEKVHSEITTHFQKIYECRTGCGGKIIVLGVCYGPNYGSQTQKNHRFMETLHVKN